MTKIIRPQTFALNQNDIARDCLGTDDPITEMRRERERLIAEKLHEGIPVTLTFNGKAVTTIYPDGRVEDHT